MTTAIPADRRVRFALLAALAVLLAHASIYRFLCDDAFISFRYARNLARGAGLVFNPGAERVEGYTNFLWVVVLAAFDRIGLRPEHVAPVLSIILTVVLFWLVASAACRWLPPAVPRFVLVLPALWLALTRSIAVWSTSGLETRLFEVLVIAGAIRLIDDIGAEESGGRWPWGAVWLGLAALTRPDGMLIGGAAMAAAAAVLVVRRRLRLKDAAPHAAVFAAIVGGHLLFRHAYYGAWLPNTYYAKVGGRAWWGMGAAYLGCFAIEYAAWLWIPALAAGIHGFVKDRRAEIPVVFGAIVVPHALYIASIGGDHFEYRPLDLYFPFLFLLIARGFGALASGVLPRWGTAAYAGLVAAGLVALPWQSHRQFPHEYSVGFPGLGAAADRVAYLDPSRDPFFRWPGLRSLAEAHRQLLRATTSRLVGVRQEEHALFLATVVPEGRHLRELVEAGTLPADTHVAISSVGAIPYFSDLRVLDRLGLTDAVVARSAPNALRIMAHDRQATLEYAARSGVDFWAEHPVHLLYRIDDDDLLWQLQRARASRSEVFFADTGGDYVVARLPQGVDRAIARFPRLTFRSATDDASYAAMLDGIIEAQRRKVALDPASHDARIALACALSERGREDEALPIFRALADAGDPDGWFNLGTVLVRRGQSDEAIAAFRRALTIDPAMAAARHNLGLALARAGHVQEAVDVLREAVRREPDSEQALYMLGAALLMARDSAGARECAEALRQLGTVDAAAYADKLTRASQ